MGKRIVTKIKEIPKKAKRFAEFCHLIMDMMLCGTDKYTGATKDEWETIDLMPKAFGHEAYIGFILNDIFKRLIRFKNERRIRDLVKIALWCYLLWNYLKEREEANVTRNV